ncbi:Hemolysin, chromosomal [Pirellulimonas nuda]|uniref:Hemolysin, chromosomal n=1 Tax=Pirellulimonas nuda TaxID=2528009 RepID=A0A518DC79_9BACT|nr:transposase [Pirellulimonas nuda]QDU89087.1 Hemolysin, chromosomal [Pirellulimonas nuda]
MSEKAKRRSWTASEKLRIVVAGLDGSVETSELCRREGINPTQYYLWKKQLMGSAAKVFDTGAEKPSAQQQRLETDAASLADVQGWLGKIDVSGRFTDLVEDKAVDGHTADDAQSLASDRLAGIALREATKQDALADRGSALSVYRAIDAALSDLTSAKQTVESADDRAAVEQQARQLGNAALLLAGKLDKDASSPDAELAAAAQSLQTHLLGTTHSYFTVFTGMGRNQVVGERETGVERYKLGAVETPEYWANPSLRLELGGQAAFVETSLPLGLSSGVGLMAASTSYGTLLGDAFVSNHTPGNAYSAPGTGFEHTLMAVNGGTVQEAYLQFDLSGQVGKRVSVAELELQTIAAVGAPGAIVLTAHRDLFGITSAAGFDEEALTWNNRASIFGGVSGTYDENFSDPLATWQPAGGVAGYDVSEAVVRATMAGDSNLNGVIDIEGWRGDLEAFYLAVHDWETYVEVYGPLASSETDLLYANDINWDGVVDGDDWDWMRQRLGLRLGDVTLDDTTNASDLSRWSANNGTTTAFGYGGYAAGDGNFDGYIDAADYSVIVNNYGTSSGLDPLSPSVTFRIAAEASGYAEFASSEHTWAAAPELVVTHIADVEVTDFSTRGTELMLRYSVWNEAFTGLSAKIYREINGDLEANPAMTVSLSSLGVGKHTKLFTAALDDATYSETDYRLVVVLEGTTASIAETDLSDNTGHFAGGVFVNVYGGVSTVHAHGSEDADAISITNEGIEIAGELATVYRFGTGSGPTFVDDDSLANGLTHSADHSGGSYAATAGFANPNTNFASTWGNDRDIAYESSNTQAQLATWTFPDLAPGVYQLSAVWQGHSNRASDATYRIFDDADLVQVHHNGQKEHSSWTGDGAIVHFESHSGVSPVTNVGFKNLGAPVAITSGTLRVELPNALVGQVVADAIRLERIDVVDPLTSGGIVIRGHGGDDDIIAATDVAFSLLVFGGDGDDILEGGAAPGVLFGGDGDDTLIGGDGDDELYGGSGFDIYDGGLGIDIADDPDISDIDTDGISNTDEALLGTDATDPDTDGDGLTDGWEVEHSVNGSLDPLDPDSDNDVLPDGDEDPDGDGATNEEEQIGGTDPNDPNSTPSTDPLAWRTYGEASIVDGVLTVGQAGRLENSGAQPAGYHGATYVLGPADSYTFTFDFSLFTWDSYNENLGNNHTGYWDSFSISVTNLPYDTLALADDPLSFPFVWGGSSYADGDEEENTQSSVELTFPGNGQTRMYLNVVLDTANPPDTDSLFPSWGEFVLPPIPVLDIRTDSENDVDIDDDDDAVEDSEAKRIFVNNDDDNKNGIPDSSNDDLKQMYTDAGEVDNDFAELQLKFMGKGDPRFAGYQLVLTASAGLKLWQDDVKTPIMELNNPPAELLPKRSYSWTLDENGDANFPKAPHAEGIAVGDQTVTWELLPPGGGEPLLSDTVKISVEGLVYPFVDQVVAPEEGEHEWQDLNTSSWEGLNVADAWWMEKALIHYIMEPGNKGKLATIHPNEGTIAYPYPGDVSGNDSTSKESYSDGFRLEFAFEFDRSRGVGPNGYVAADLDGDGPNPVTDKLSFVANSGPC